jgi:hypothetical protein
MIEQDMGFGPPLARRNLAHGNIARHNEVVVESSESSLFLKRNLCCLPPSACCPRKLSVAPGKTGKGPKWCRGGPWFQY